MTTTTETPATPGVAPGTPALRTWLEKQSRSAAALAENDPGLDEVGMAHHYARTDAFGEVLEQLRATEMDGTGFPAPGGHALLTEHHGETITAHCECGEPLGQSDPATSPAVFGAAWSAHMAREG